MTFQRMGVAAAFVGMMSVLGCGPAGPKTYPVSGKVELPAGDVKVLAGSNIEASLDGDSTVRASGVIGEDGGFALETLHEGRILKGAREGTYQARIILTEDDKDLRRQAARTIDPKALQFQTSGLTFQVPASSAVTLKVPKR